MSSRLRAIELAPARWEGRIVLWILLRIKVEIDCEPCHHRIVASCTSPQAKQGGGCRLKLQHRLISRTGYGLDTAFDMSEQKKKSSPLSNARQPTIPGPCLPGLRLWCSTSQTDCGGDLQAQPCSALHIPETALDGGLSHRHLTKSRKGRGCSTGASAREAPRVSHGVH